MRVTPAIASAATALAALAVLSGCGGGGDDSDSAAGSPSPTPTRSATPPPSPTQSASTEPASSSAPASSAPASESPTSAPTQSSGGTVHSYQDLYITLPVADTAISDAPTGLTEYVRQILETQWDHYGHTAACEKAPQVEVMATRSDGFAYVFRAADPSVANCPDAMADSGGYRAVLKDVDGTWRQVMSFQDVPECRTFEKWDVPSKILAPDDKCAKGNSVVTYVHG